MPTTCNCAVRSPARNSKVWPMEILALRHRRQRRADDALTRLVAEPAVHPRYTARTRTGWTQLSGKRASPFGTPSRRDVPSDSEHCARVCTRASLGCTLPAAHIARLQHIRRRLPKPNNCCAARKLSSACQDRLERPHRIPLAIHRRRQSQAAGVGLQRLAIRAPKLRAAAARRSPTSSLCSRRRRRRYSRSQRESNNSGSFRRGSAGEGL